ncbi:MAG: hypothetical protein PHN82_06630 [bacterium]|nr:hypothetical protein [bacterium]
MGAIDREGRRVYYNRHAGRGPAGETMDDAVTEISGEIWISF